MIRLFLMWAMLTGALFGFYYFVDLVQKKETAKWFGRLLWCGLLPAVGIAGAIFLERL
jgi:hypothetical protein